MNKEKIFIFSIAYNCGKVVNKMLDSFHKHHDQQIYIFGTKKDFESITPNKNNILIKLDSDYILRGLFLNGHLGTSYLWAKVLKREFGNYDYVIQIDSDVIFRTESLNTIIEKFVDGYDLIGPRRPYKTLRNNHSNLSENLLKSLPDVVSTYIIGVNINKIKDYPFEVLHQMIVGYYNPLQFPTIDFFDPVSFDILNNQGKIFYLDINEYGSSDENGESKNDFEQLNKTFDCGYKLIHFAGIGSGMNFYYNGNGNVPPTYAEWAKKRFALYLKIFYNEELDVEYNYTESELIKNYLKL